MSRVELAKRAGITPEGVGLMERGGGAPSLAMLMKLVRVLGCSWNDILGPPPHDDEQEPDYRAGYRAGVGDAAAAVRKLLDD